MHVLKDGSFRVEKGERFPFICPKCMTAIPYAGNLAMVKCPRCQYIGMADEFSKMGMVFFDIDKQTNKFGLWWRLTLYPIVYPIIRLLLWAMKKPK